MTWLLPHQNPLNRANKQRWPSPRRAQLSIKRATAVINARSNVSRENYKILPGGLRMMASPPGAKGASPAIIMETTGLR